MKKRLLSLLLCGVLLLSMLPVTALAADVPVAAADPAEQFPALTPGNTYWFDLSGEGIPETKNSSLPDGSLHWVPFTYAGTINAYVLNEKSNGKANASQLASETSDPNGQYGYTYDHSLFVADYAVAQQLPWFDLKDRKMIFGTSYASGGVDYTMRAPSGGSGYTDTSSESDDTRGTPRDNEWDVLLSKDIGYIKNYDIGSYAQDTSSDRVELRVLRGRESVFYFAAVSAAEIYKPFYGFRPVLELPAPDALPSGLKVVTLDLNGGKIGSETGPVSIVVKSGESFAAPSGEGLTAPSGKVFGGWTNSGTTYTAGDTVPASVSELTVVWAAAPTITTQPENKTVSVGETATFTVTANGEPAPTYQWQMSKDSGSSWEDISGATGDSYTTEAATMSMNGWQYRCVVTNSAGNATSDAATLTVTPLLTQYTIRVTADPAGGGSVTGGGTYAENMSVTVTATAKDGYHFAKWTEGGNEVCASASYAFAVKGDRTLVAVFEQDSVTPPDPGHTHAWATSWSKDATHHWRECTAQGCDLSDNS